MRNPEKVVNDCIRDLEKAGWKPGKIKEIKVGDEEWSERYDGFCELNDDDTYTITIAKIFFREDCPYRLIREVVYHELIHTMPHCMDHKWTWTHIAQHVDDKFGTHIVEYQGKCIRNLYGFKP